MDLAAAEELEASLERRRTEERTAEAPMLAGLLGPGAPWSAAIDRRRRFPLPFRAPASPPDMVAARLIADPEMDAVFRDADVALLETSERRRQDLAPDGLYVVSLGGEALLRYIRPGARWHYTATAANLNTPIRWRELLLTSADLSEIVKARVRWLGRARDRNLPFAQRGRFLYDATSI